MMTTPTVFASPARYQIEPDILRSSFHRSPPSGFTSWAEPSGVTGFTADFDVLTTVPEWRARLSHGRLAGLVRRALTWRTAFVGSAVTEYTCLPNHIFDLDIMARRLRDDLGARHTLLIIKDLPCDSPFLSDDENRHADAFMRACERAGYTVVDGQALAYLPIEFDSIDDYIKALPYNRRKDIRRRIKSRQDLDITIRHAGDPHFENAALRADYYEKYLAVYDNGELHFDLLTREFFDELLVTPTAGSAIFEYRHHGELVGWELCYVHGGNLLSKYIGMNYTLSRRFNLYFVSWMVCLEYALAHGCRHFFVGATAPDIKAKLGARFTPTRHAVYSRHLLLRGVLRCLRNRLEHDRQWTTNRSGTLIAE